MNDKNFIGRQMNVLVSKLLVAFVKSSGIDTSEMLRFSDMYEKWTPGMTLYKDDYVRHEADENGHTKVYKIKLNGISQANIPPGIETSVNFYELLGYVNDVRIWVRPITTADGYAVGDIVSYNGNTYENTIENNGFRPDQHGWTQV